MKLNQVGFSFQEFMYLVQQENNGMMYINLFSKFYYFSGRLGFFIFFFLFVPLCQSFSQEVMLHQDNDVDKFGIVVGKVSSEPLQLRTITYYSSCGRSNGEIYADAVGGTPPYLFSIDGLNFVSANVFSGLYPANYLVTVMDAVGTTDSFTTIVFEFAAPQIVLTATQLSCNNTGGSINIFASGGMQPYLYSIDSGLRFQNNNIFNNLVSGKYVAVVKDAHGCLDTGTIEVMAIYPPTVFLGNDTAVCEGQSLVLNAPANINATYSWQDGSSSSTFNVNNPGLYSLRVSENGCSGVGDIVVSYLNKPVVNLKKDTTVCFAEQLVLNAFYPNSIYKWQDGSEQSQFIVSKAGIYTVLVSNDCGTTSNTTTVKYSNCTCNLYMANAFTPDNDGNNDLFRPSNQCLFNNYSFKIFNRFGQLIFTANNPAYGWNGNFNGQNQPAGTYIWLIQYNEKETGKLITKNGTVTLLR